MYRITELVMHVFYSQAHVITFLSLYVRDVVITFANVIITIQLLIDFSGKNCNHYF